MTSEEAGGDCVVDGTHRSSNDDEIPTPNSNIQKYYKQRRHLFSKFDDGIRMTAKSWFEVTPESVAIQTAKNVADYASPTKTVLIDCFCGVGGNTIAFACSDRWSEVIGIDIDPEAIECAKINAEIYGVDDKIRWINGDCFKVLRDQFRDMQDQVVIFASPPWGGPDYTYYQVFDLKAMQPYSIDCLVRELSSVSTELVLFLPRNSNLNQLAMYAEEGSKLQVVHYCVYGASKGIGVYLGHFPFVERHDDPTEEKFPTLTY